MDALFFASQDDFRAWLDANHDTATVVYVGYYKVGTGKPSITYKQSVDQALCYGWIDGVRNTIDDERYTLRFTPRKPKSIWSAVNLKRFEELRQMGMVHPAGLRVFENRDPKMQQKYSFEQPEESIKFTEAQAQRFRANEAAWAYWQKAPKGYVNAATWWVISAKQDATREKRLTELIDNSAQGLRVPQFRRPEKKK